MRRRTPLNLYSIQSVAIYVHSHWDADIGLDCITDEGGETYLTILGWLMVPNCLRRAISLIVELGMPSSESVTRTFFRATNCPGFCGSMALYTVP